MRYDINIGTFLENYIGVRLLSSCDCWALNLGVTQTRNPNEVQVQAQFTLAGLGNAARRIAGSTETGHGSRVRPGYRDTRGGPCDWEGGAPSPPACEQHPAGVSAPRAGPHLVAGVAASARHGPSIGRPAYPARGGSGSSRSASHGSRGS